jgi:glycosyltransferase involved in cell wall biosynthesis
MSGVDLRCWQMLNLLRQHGEVGLFALAGEPQPPQEFPHAPWVVTGSANQPLDQTSWIKQPDALPSHGYFDERSASSLVELMREFAPDVVVLDQLWMHSYESAARSSNVKLVLNSHNVEASLARQMADHESYPPARLQRKVFASRVEKLEREIANRVDQLWVCSEEDRARFLESGVRTAMHVVPNAIDVARYQRPADRPVELSGTGPFVLFTGAFHYLPNANAANFLIREVFPLLTQAHPEGRLLLIGVNPTAEMLAAAERDQRIVVTGRIPDTIPFLQHGSMLLVPLFEGGGTRFKIVEAFAAGLPVISSSIGAEGLGAIPGEHFLLAGTAGECMNAIGVLVNDHEQRRKIVQSAAGFVERFSWRAAGQSVGAALQELGL